MRLPTPVLSQLTAPTDRPNFLYATLLPAYASLLEDTSPEDNGVLKGGAVNPAVSGAPVFLECVRKSIAFHCVFSQRGA
jgi:hypothetical protein